MGKTIAEETEGTRFAGVMPDYTQGHQHWDAITSELAERKPEIEVVNETFPDFGAGDYQNEIQETLDAEPDIVFTSMWAGDIITFIKQAKQFDFFEEVPHFVSGSGSSIDVMTALGDELPEMIGSDYWDPFFPDTEENFEFVKAYSDNFDAGTTVDKEGSKWDGLTVPNHSTTEPVYSGIKALQLAAEEGGGTTFDDLVAGLEGLTYPSPKGERTIRASDHENIPSIELTGLIGEVDYWQFPGYKEMFTQPGDAITDEPTITCN
jgi:branched-chain amino acid transport system substrate-binding protein